MAIQNFDQLNNLRKYAEIGLYREGISEEKQKKRIDLCMEFTELMLLLFMMITEERLEPDEYVAFLEERISIIAGNYIGVDDLAYINDWSKKQAQKIVDATEHLFEDEIEEEQEKNAEEDETEKEKTESSSFDETTQAKSEAEKNEEEKREEDVIHFEEYGVDIPKSEYPTSEFRACLISVYCVTAVDNYYDYYAAVNRGCTKKVWICEFSKYSRETHKNADHQTVNINTPFNVGNSYMMIPGDESYNPEEKELYGCTCYCEYY
jgi:hypothetical protein